MAEARVARPKGITKTDWDAFIDKVGAYRDLDHSDPGNEALLQQEAGEIADQTAVLFLEPVQP
jgi:hypothetical protein